MAAVVLAARWDLLSSGCCCRSSPPRVGSHQELSASALRLKRETIFSTSTEQSTPAWFLHAGDFLLRMIFSNAVQTSPQAHLRCIKFVSFFRSKVHVCLFKFFTLPCEILRCLLPRYCSGETKVSFSFVFSFSFSVLCAKNLVKKDFFRKYLVS